MSESPLMSAADLATALKRDEVLVVDCRSILGDAAKAARDYESAHIPGAVFADLERDLSDLSKTGLGRHPLPDDAAFSATLARWGWRRGMIVVAYDDASGALAAARLWWMLRAIGETRAFVLDGGLAAWKAAGLPLEAGVVTRPPSIVGATFDRDAQVDYEALQRGLADGSLALLDARAAPRFRGEIEPIDRAAGHVPGARNRPYSDNLLADGRFKSPEELRRDFGAFVGDKATSSVVHMCGSGVTACHNLLAMEHAGLSGSRLFAPSWSGWSADPARPIATGDA